MSSLALLSLAEHSLRRAAMDRFGRSSLFRDTQSVVVFWRDNHHVFTSVLLLGMTATAAGACAPEYQSPRQVQLRRRAIRSAPYCASMDVYVAPDTSLAAHANTSSFNPLRYDRFLTIIIFAYRIIDLFR